MGGATDASPRVRSLLTTSGHFILVQEPIMLPVFVNECSFLFSRYTFMSAFDRLPNRDHILHTATTRPFLLLDRLKDFAALHYRGSKHLPFGVGSLDGSIMAL